MTEAHSAIRVFTAMDIGHVRERQEDSCFARAWPQGMMAILAIADGMGGHAGGHIASELAIETATQKLTAYFDGLQPSETVKLNDAGSKETQSEYDTQQEPVHTSRQDFRTRKLSETKEDEQTAQFQKMMQAAIKETHEAILQAAGDAQSTAVHRDDRPEFSRPDKKSPVGSTTLTLAAVLGHDLYIAHVGDSRAYHWHQSRLEQLTHDHSGAAMLAAAGVITPDEARDHPASHQLYRFLGGKENAAESDFIHVKLVPGDLLLLCSDGLWNRVTDMEIASCLIEHTQIDTLAQFLVDAANEQGGEDNISVVVATIP